MRRCVAILIVIAFIFSNSIVSFACDENQSDTHVTEILFGDNALRYTSDENTKMLLNAVYLCCEQSDGRGQDKLDYLHSKKVKKTGSVNDINVKNSELIECSHIVWGNDYIGNTKASTNRRGILQRTVNRVFDFGTFNNWFGSDSGKCNSFAAILYYSHILSDYLADDPEDTRTSYKGKEISSYSGQPYVELNGNKPNFSSVQRNSKDSFVNYSQLDTYGRAGVAFACISSEMVSNVGPRANMVSIKPTGFNLNKDNYSGIVNSQPPYLYNRCHLLAHSLGGDEIPTNLVTGTRYMNTEGMGDFEDKILKYIQKTGNHVLYRITPAFSGNNLIVSGVQLEAYSVEDMGKGISFNVYCYNVQPGVNINYLTGDNELADLISYSGGGIPFAVNNPNDNNPDLIYEMNRHLEILFDDQKGTGIYTTMMGDINTIGYEARSLGTLDETSAQTYAKMKQCEYKYYQTLRTYVPMLLKNEDFFNEVFK